jgi:hypothetical protein
VWSLSEIVLGRRRRGGQRRERRKRNCFINQSIKVGNEGSLSAQYLVLRGGDPQKRHCGGPGCAFNSAFPEKRQPMDAGCGGAASLPGKEKIHLSPYGKYCRFLPTSTRPIKTAGRATDPGLPHHEHKEISIFLRPICPLHHHPLASRYSVTATPSGTKKESRGGGGRGKELRPAEPYYYTAATISPHRRASLAIFGESPFAVLA